MEEKIFEQQNDIRRRFEDALQVFTEKLKPDPNVIAVILCGSLSNDTVWEKSDMDVNVIVREQKLPVTSFCVEEDGLIINVDIKKEFDFKRTLERSLGGGFLYSYYAKAKIIHTKDESLRDYLTGAQNVGADDRALIFFQMTTGMIYFIEKTEKWLTVKKDLQYAQLWILKATEHYANMRLVLDNKPPSREAILKVMEYAPELIEHLYKRPMQGFMSFDEIKNALNFFVKFLEDNVELIKKPVIEFMSDGEMRTVTALVKHFGCSSHDIYHVFDFLAQMGVVGRMSEMISITPKSKKAIDEVMFIYSEKLNDAGMEREAFLSGGKDKANQQDFMW